ncbi:MAG: FAD:protein FMN transferase [Duodenibacillus sp.]|nr:FAD:protein FMN transferase [Duodenibacillus sp.]
MKHLWIRLAAVALIAAAASTGASAASGKKTYAPRGEALPNQVERLLVEKRYDEALKVAEDGLKANGMSVQLRFQRAVVLERMGRAEDAIAAFEEIIRTYPEIPEPYNNLAAIYSQQGKLDRAEELLKKVDYRKVTVGADNTVTMEEGVEADLGCITKGYCSDRVLQLFAERGIQSAIVNLGGNVQTLGTKVNGSLWRIALIDPFGNGYAGMVTVENKAVITSGGYERYFVEDGVTYHHIMDPKTGSTARTGLSSATVVTDRGVRGDGLSTALFVLGVEGAADLWRTRGDFEMVLITDGGDVLITPGLKDSFTLLDSYMGKEVRIIE